MISSSFLVLFVKPSIVLCWLYRRICWFVMMFCISVIDVVIAADIVVLDICNNELGLDLQLQDIGRTHPIGPVQDDKADIIARFISYRPRQFFANSSVSSSVLSRLATDCLSCSIVFS
jgi:hypothetical protein